MTETEARPRRTRKPPAAGAIRPGPASKRKGRAAKTSTPNKTGALNKAGAPNQTRPAAAANSHPKASTAKVTAAGNTLLDRPNAAPADPPARRSLPWAEIRSTYEDSSLAVAVIAKAYGVRERAIYERAQREGWAHRRGTAERGEGAASAKALVAGTGFDKPGLDRSVLVSRLFRAVERQIDEIDKRILQLQSDGVDERDARTLAALAKTLELLIGLERQTRPEVVDTPEADIDAFRRDLARRIQSLQATEGD